jgi:hypothetical protein
MHRVLVVYRGPIEVGQVRRRCVLPLDEPVELALCLVLPPGSDGFSDGLRAQKEITAALRAALGQRAETVAVLVACEGSAYDVDDCAREWGATLVVP